MLLKQKLYSTPEMVEPVGDRMRKLLILIAILLASAITSDAAIIFQDNFDTCTTNCNTCSGVDYWDQWVVSGGCSLTLGGVTHNAGEITTPGRGGTGKSYKIWRHSTSWPDFSGGLVKYFPGSYHDIWFRYYIKIPAAMGLNGGEYCKWWIINPSGGEGVYLDIMAWEPGAGYLVITNYNIGGTSTVTVLNAADTASILDGNWHSFQFHFNNTTQIGTLQLYVDGVLKYNNTSYDWGTTAAWDFIQHFHIGNRGSTTVWQSSWQVMEIDDFVMATTKAETDPDDADTTPPGVSSASIGSDGQTVTVNFTETVVTTGYDNGDFNLDCSSAGSDISLNSISGSGSSRTFTAASTINSGDTCNLDYVGTTNEIEDSAGNDLGGTLTNISVTNNSTQGSSANLLLTETFNDSSMPNQNDTWGIWNASIFDTSTKYSGASSVRFAWAALAEQPTGVNNAVRWNFTSTDTLYMSVYWRFDSTWRGSGFGFHPHLIYILPTVDTNLSAGDLRIYVETTDSDSNYAIPRMIIARGESADWYTASSSYNMSANTWHKVECYLVNNTIGSANGVLQMWIDGVQVLNVSNATFRTSSSIHFAAVAVGPWMSNGGQGPNLAQTMWMDEMVFYDGIPSGSDTTAPTVTAFTITATTSTSRTITINTFTATDAVGVTGYCANESATAPSSSTCSGSGWVGTAPTSYTFSSDGSKTLYGWAKDAAGNVSTSLSDTITVDSTGPAVSSITISSSGASMSVLFSEVASIGSGGNGGFALSANGGAATLTYSSGSGSNTLVYSISRDIKAGETVTLSYTQPGNGVEDALGNDTASFSGTSVTNNSTQQFTITASNGSNGSISPVGAVGVNYGGSQTFTITPVSHYHISDVTVDGVSQGAVSSYTFTNVTANRIIVATFAIDTYTITSSAGSNGAISPLGSTAVNYNGSQSYTITANAHYAVNNVVVDGSSVGAVTSYTFSNVTTNHTIAATFAQITWTITSSAGANGSISPLGATVVIDGNNQAFSISPNTGYHIADILVDSASVGTSSPYTFTNVTANHTISATFSPSPPHITASAGSNGVISPTGEVEVTIGGSKQFVVVPNLGYCVADMLVDSSSVGKKGYYEFTNVLTDRTISVTFEACDNKATLYQR